MRQRILINCSNLLIGGGIQVALSFIQELKKRPDLDFVIVLSKPMEEALSDRKFPTNFQFVRYTISPSVLKIFSGKDKVLTGLVRSKGVSAVFSIFGPSYWRPPCWHVVGFARPHYVYKESPFFQQISPFQKFIWYIKERLHCYDFKANNDCLITENPDVTARLKKLIPNKPIRTITNNFHQVFSDSRLWNSGIELPTFDGFTLLTISANYPHKNLKIIKDVVVVLMNRYPDFKFRFVVTLEKKEFDFITNPYVREKILTIGPIDINECPNLYNQVDAMFLPSLLECFSASYPEAMKMEKPILTSKLTFAEGLCRDAALYFDPLDAQEIAEKIVYLARNANVQARLISNGLKRLELFDSFSKRAEKYLELIIQDKYEQDSWK